MSLGFFMVAEVMQVSKARVQSLAILIDKATPVGIQLCWYIVAVVRYPWPPAGGSDSVLCPMNVSWHAVQSHGYTAAVLYRMRTPWADEHLIRSAAVRLLGCETLWNCLLVEGVGTGTLS